MGGVPREQKMFKGHVCEREIERVLGETSSGVEAVARGVRHAQEHSVCVCVYVYVCVCGCVCV